MVVKGLSALFELKKETSFCDVLLMYENHSLYIKYFCTQNYALKSAILPHADTPSPEVTECSRSL